MARRHGSIAVFRRAGPQRIPGDHDRGLLGLLRGGARNGRRGIGGGDRGNVGRVPRWKAVLARVGSEKETNL
jgi:hypothetical protein